MHSLLGSCRQALLYIQKNDHHLVGRLFEELYACMIYAHQHNLVCVFVLSQPWMQRVVRCTNYNAAEIHWGLAAKLREMMLLLGSCRQFHYSNCTYRGCILIGVWPPISSYSFNSLMRLFLTTDAHLLPLFTRPSQPATHRRPFIPMIA